MELLKQPKILVLKNDDIYNEFNLAAETNPTKAGPWKEKAFSIKSKSDSIVQMIQNLKFSLVMLAEDKGYFRR